MDRKIGIKMALVLGLGMLVFLSPTTVTKASSKNPIYATLIMVQNAISDAVKGVKGILANHEKRISDLEKRVTFLESLLTPTPSPSPAPSPTPAPIPQTIYIVSDSTWKYSVSGPTGWYLNGFDDSSWSQTVAPSAGLCPINAQEVPVRINEHGALPMWKPNPVNHEIAYFRKHFNLPKTATGTVRAVFDDVGEIYINGQLALTDTINNGTDMTTGSVSQYLTTGDNVIAIRVYDGAGGCQTIQFEMELIY